MKNNETANILRKFISILLFKLVHLVCLRLALGHSRHDTSPVSRSQLAALTHQRSPSWALICYPRSFPAEPERFHALARWGKQIRDQSSGRDKTTSREEAGCQILVPPE